MPHLDDDGRRVFDDRERHRPTRGMRTPMSERDASARAADFDEVGYGYSPDEALAEAMRCLQCKNPTCQQGCPVNIDIRGFIREIIDGNWADGVTVLKERNALPAVCGRVCPQEEQCEKTCVLAKKGEPIAIGRLERFLGDYDLSCDLEHRCVPETDEPSGFRCAVVGSGPAGLACAGELARLGHDVTVLESLHAPGGVLSYGIPEFRLPKHIVDAEIEALTAMGVEIVTDYVVGRLASADELMAEEGYDAVFLGVGAGLPVFMGIPGENLNGVYSANEFLTRVNLMGAYDFPARRHTRLARPQGGCRGRRQRCDGFRTHRTQARRRGGLSRLPTHRGRDAGTSRGGSPRARGGRRVQDALRAVGDHRP